MTNFYSQYSSPLLLETGTKMLSIQTTHYCTSILYINSRSIEVTPIATSDSNQLTFLVAITTCIMRIQTIADKDQMTRNNIATTVVPRNLSR